MKIEDLIEGKEYMATWDYGHDIVIFRGIEISGKHKGQAIFNNIFSSGDGIFDQQEVSDYISEINPPSFDDNYTKALKQGQLIMITELQSTLLSMAKHSQDMTEESAALRAMKCIKEILISSRKRLEGEL